MESASKLLEICGFRVNYIGPNDYKKVALAKAKDQILLQNGFFYFEVEIINKGDDGIIGVGFCRNPKNLNTITKDSNLMPGLQEKDSWGYHDDGYFFRSGSGMPYGPSYTTNDIIGCYLNFRERIMFYTKNGVNLGIAYLLPKISGNSKEIWYPYVGLRSQGGSIEVNFGYNKKFKYSAMNNDDIGESLDEKNCLEFFYNNELDQLLEAIKNLTKVIEHEPTDLLALTCRGKAYFIIGNYKGALADFTKVLENESENTLALRYRAEISQIMKNYYESSNDLTELLKIKPDDEWAKNARDLVVKTFWESTFEAFRLDRPDSSLDLFTTLVRKGDEQLPTNQ